MRNTRKAFDVISARYSRALFETILEAFPEVFPEAFREIFFELFPKTFHEGFLVSRSQFPQFLFRVLKLKMSASCLRGMEVINSYSYKMTFFLSDRFTLEDISLVTQNKHKKIVYIQDYILTCMALKPQKIRSQLKLFL